MSFRFSLATLLRYREAMERREQIALERLQQQIHGMELQLQETQRLLAAASREKETELARGVKAIQLQNAVYEEHLFQSTCEELTRSLRDLGLKRAEQIKSYTTAQRKREVVEKLRNQGLAAFNREQVKLEQAMIDDLYLARRSR